jgi:glucokinase
MRIARRLMPRRPSPLTPKALAEAARAGVPGAGRVWREAGTWLGQGLANAVLMFNPDAVILLGGVARAGALLRDPVLKVFALQPFREPFDALTLATPAEDREWGCVGAALLSRERR